MTPVLAWTHSFQTIGFAFMIIGTILTLIGIVAINTLTLCPTGGCVYNPALAMTPNLLPARLTLVIAGIVVIWMVKVGGEREVRESS